MKRILVGAWCLLATFGVTFSAESGVIVRIDRRAVDDLATLRAAGIPIVHEMDTCLILRGDAKHLAWLEGHGYDATALGADAPDDRYLVVGLRPDSDRAAIEAAGTVLLEEGNWVLLRLAAGVGVPALHDAKVFVTPVRETPLDAPRGTPSLARPAEVGIQAADPLVQKMVNAVSPTQINQAWTDLTNNPPTGTRYTTSQGCADAGTYCYNRFASYKVAPQYQTWSTTHKPNVIGTNAGAIHPENVFIVIGHLDDLPSTGLAPGADDNASGTVNVLESARVMGCWAFRNTVKFIACTGEESGLLGSDAYAADAAARGENILGVINMDMIGWAGNGSPSPENLDLNYNAASEDLGLRFAQAAATYGTGLVVDAFLCPSLSASDHYSFWTRGWKAVCGITDNEGYCSHSGNYPYYHTSNDTIANNGNPAFFHSVVKTSVATLAELAEPFKITFDRSSYACSGVPIQIALGDRDLNSNAGLVETVTVAVASTTEPAPESVVLTETSADSMIFKGSIATTGAPTTHGDGLLSVAPGDTITSSYNDALDCDGATNVAYQAVAQTDCVAPAISNVAASNVTGSGALVTWTTNEPSTSVVRYGTQPPVWSTTSSAALVTSHAVQLTGLTECSTYSFWVESVDAAGNVVTADNGGAWYGFATGKNVNPVYPYTGTPVAIPDNNATGASVSVSVPDVNTIVDVNVKANITHTYDGDLTLYLIGPDGTTVTLSNQRGGSGDNFTNTVFDDQAATAIASGSAPFTGSYKPDQALSVFNGKNPSGTWRLKVVDSGPNDLGNITGFELQLTFPPQACGPSLEVQSTTATDTCNGSGLGGGNNRIEPGEIVTLVVTARDNGTASVTGVSATLTTATPGVTVTDAGATFPDIAAGGSAPSNPNHFTFFVDPAFPCGGTIGLTVQFTANEGSWSSSFSLPTGTPGQATNTYPSTDVPKAIIDSGTITSTLPIANTGTVQDVNVNLTLTHTYDGDLVLTLIGPNGTRVPLANNRGSSGDNFTNTTFDDEASTPIASGSAPFTGSYRPDSPLTALDGIPANGTWSLEIRDTASGDYGTLQSWSVTLTTSAAPSCQACSPLYAGEATALAFDDRDTMTWSAAANATSHGVYRGAAFDLPALLTHAVDSCARASVVGTSTGDLLTEIPSADAFFWYLVRGWNGTGEGPAGNATAGPRIQEAGGVCP